MDGLVENVRLQEPCGIRGPQVKVVIQLSDLARYLPNVPSRQAGVDERSPKERVAALITCVCKFEIPVYSPVILLEPPKICEDL